MDMHVEFVVKIIKKNHKHKHGQMHNFVTLQQLVPPATTVFYKVNPFVLESNGRETLKVTLI